MKHPPSGEASLSHLWRWAGDVLEQSDACFAQGTDNARDEAAWLVLHALGEPVDAPVTDPDRMLGAEQVAAVVRLVQARVRREPAAYLTGSAWFCGLEFAIDRRAIVPRSPIAELIQQRFAPFLDTEPRRILDLCTGCGCIAIACAMAFPQAQVVASDLSPQALELAQRNVTDFALDERVRLLQSNVFDALGGERFDLIVSNPPYVPSSVVDRLPAELRREPRMALDGGEQGMDVVARILHQARSYLSEQGLLVVEVGDFKDELLRIFPGANFVWPQLANGGSGVLTITAKRLARLA